MLLRILTKFDEGAINRPDYAVLLVSKVAKAKRKITPVSNHLKWRSMVTTCQLT